MLLLLLQLVQDPGLVLNASVDKARLTVGEEVVLTVVAGGLTADAVDIALPDFAGFTVVSRTERSDVTLGVSRSRVVTLELRLRALKAGNYAFGPIRAQQGQAAGSIDGPDIEVTESAAAGMLALNPRVRELVARAPPPRAAGRVGLSVEVTRDTVLVGEQVDLLTAAWFPRDLRAQLRRQPVLQPPVLDGVWSFPQAAPPGIAASKRVGEKWYDLFVAHQVVFPLAAGEVRIPTASLRYAVPVATQFFSQEERFNVTSEPRRLVVQPLPTAGQPAGFSGATGRDLKLERTVTPSAGRAGEALTVAVSVRGEGNVGLWPAPEIEWPGSVRAYAEGSSEEMQSVAGRLTGVKHFKFVVVPSESGVLAVPAVRYPYFDFARRAYVTAALPSLGVAVGAAREASTARTLPPPLLTPGGAPLAEQVIQTVPPWGWAGIAALPPLLVAGLSVRRRRRVPRIPARRRSDDPDLSLDRALAALVGRGDIATSEHLVPALRSVGIGEAEARSIAALRDRLQRHRYGPPAGDLAPERVALERALDLVRGMASSRPARALSLLLLLGGNAWAQAASPESLYAGGALRRAAAGFEAGLATDPRDPALWYNLGASRYRLGEDGAAAAAWITARRLAPRDGTVRRALLLTPPPDQVSAGRRSVPPLSAAEMLVVALLAWWAAWGLILSRRASRAVPVLFLIAVLASGSALLTWWWNRRPLGLVATDAPLRVAPHGRAAGSRNLASGTAVLVERELPGWVLVRAGGDERGWMPADVVVAVGQ
jgi:hypothetical protein